jgi:ribulose-phosphate 3-epimerase
MIDNPDQFIPEFAGAGADWISVHQEACVHLDRTLHLIASHGCKRGVVINPATPVKMLTEVLDLVHLVLVMSVNPGAEIHPERIEQNCGASSDARRAKTGNPY